MNRLTLHTKAYYRAVNDALSNAATRQEVIDALTAIKDALLNGTFPR